MDALDIQLFQNDQDKSQSNVIPEDHEDLWETHLSLIIENLFSSNSTID